MMQVINNNIELFNDVRLIVSEGIYRAESQLKPYQEIVKRKIKVN